MKLYYIALLFCFAPIASHSEDGIEIVLNCTLEETVVSDLTPSVRKIDIGYIDEDGYWVEDGETSGVFLVGREFSHMDMRGLVRNENDNAIDSIVITQPGYHSGTRHFNASDGGVVATMTSQYLDDDYQLIVSVFRGTCKSPEGIE